MFGNYIDANYGIVVKNSRQETYHVRNQRLFINNVDIKVKTLTRVDFQKVVQIH